MLINIGVELFIFFVLFFFAPNCEVISYYHRKTSCQEILVSTFEVSEGPYPFQYDPVDEMAEA